MCIQYSYRDRPYYIPLLPIIFVKKNKVNFRTISSLKVYIYGPCAAAVKGLARSDSIRGAMSIY